MIRTFSAMPLPGFVYPEFGTLETQLRSDGPDTDNIVVSFPEGGPYFPTIGKFALWIGAGSGAERVEVTNRSGDMLVIRRNPDAKLAHAVGTSVALVSVQNAAYINKNVLDRLRALYGPADIQIFDGPDGGFRVTGGTAEISVAKGTASLGGGTFVTVYGADAVTVPVSTAGIEEGKEKSGIVYLDGSGNVTIDLGAAAAANASTPPAWPVTPHIKLATIVVDDEGAVTAADARMQGVKPIPPALAAALTEPSTYEILDKAEGGYLASDGGPFTVAVAAGTAYLDDWYFAVRPAESVVLSEVDPGEGKSVAGTLYLDANGGLVYELGAAGTPGAAPEWPDTDHVKICTFSIDDEGAVTVVDARE